MTTPEDWRNLLIDVTYLSCTSGRNLQARLGPLFDLSSSKLTAADVNISTVVFNHTPFAESYVVGDLVPILNTSMIGRMIHLILAGAASDPDINNIRTSLLWIDQQVIPFVLRRLSENEADVSLASTVYLYLHKVSQEARGLDFGIVCSILATMCKQFPLTGNHDTRAFVETILGTPDSRAARDKLSKVCMLRLAFALPDSKDKKDIIHSLGLENIEELEEFNPAAPLPEIAAAMAKIVAEDHRWAFTADPNSTHSLCVFWHGQSEVVFAKRDNEPWMCSTSGLIVAKANDENKELLSTWGGGQMLRWKPEFEPGLQAYLIHRHGGIGNADIAAEEETIKMIVERVDAM